MLIDLNVSLPDFNSLENFDTVIIGAGAAGITLADKLSSLGKKNCLN